MAKDVQPSREDLKRQIDIDGGKDKTASANPPNEGGPRPVAPGGSGGGSEKGQGKPRK